VATPRSDAARRLPHPQPYLIENPARELERLVREHGFRGLKLYPTYGYFYPKKA